MHIYHITIHIHHNANMNSGQAARPIWEHTKLFSRNVYTSVLRPKGTGVSCIISYKLYPETYRICTRLSHVSLCPYNLYPYKNSLWAPVIFSYLCIIWWIQHLHTRLPANHNQPTYGLTVNYLIHYFFSSALCYCTAELLSSRRHPSSVRRLSTVVRPLSVKSVVRWMASNENCRKN